MERAFHDTDGTLLAGSSRLAPTRGFPRFESQGEQHDVFAGAMEIPGHGDAVHELIAVLEGEPQAAMEGDRRRVEGARLGRDDRSAAPANEGGEALVELAPKAETAVIGVHSQEMDVGLLRMPL